MSEIARAKRRKFGAAGAGVLAVSLVIIVSGCSALSTKTAPTASHSVSPTPTATPTAVPTLDPAGDAKANLAFFDHVSMGVLAANAEAGGADFINALSANGFDKTQMQVTFDRTAVDLAADSIQFSVRINDQCLIGQNGPATQGYHSMVAPILATGMCLVGTTRQIDW
ncbi:hypothetical protein GCM10022381_10250 [Leifsonia kafniensis]|uniref:DUF6993 domain-containing protein n=1 Tax=Leifsonia kafniensis TaxID=475957 RepID=A0ABP7K861_9MICO